MSFAAFGPGGNCDLFRERGYKSTLQAPGFVREMGLDLYEYEAGRGVPDTPDLFAELGERARGAGIRLTFHAPYFISLSGVDPEKRLGSLKYIRQSLDAAHRMGAETVVVHTGSAGKISREEAMRLAADTLDHLLCEVDTYGIKVGLETMGKVNQLGTLDEVIRLCSASPALVPVVDFGHLNARDRGGVFRCADDFRRVFDAIGERLGDRVARDLHCHFSKIEWTDGGEKCHLTFADTTFGPDFEPFCEAIAKEGVAPTVVSESAGTQTLDALAMKRHYLAEKEKT